MKCTNIVHVHLIKNLSVFPLKDLKMWLNNVIMYVELYYRLSL